MTKKSQGKHSQQYGPQKGKRWEKQFSQEFLSLWWSHGKEQNLFYRTHGSGTIRSFREGFGDVLAVNEHATPLTNVYVFELKSYERLNLFSLVDTGFSKVEEWWAKLQVEAAKCGREPVLIIRHGKRIMPKQAISKRTLKSGEVITVVQEPVGGYIGLRTDVFRQLRTSYPSAEMNDLQDTKMLCWKTMGIVSWWRFVEVVTPEMFLGIWARGRKSR